MQYNEEGSSCTLVYSGNHLYLAVSNCTLSCTSGNDAYTVNLTSGETVNLSKWSQCRGPNVEFGMGKTKVKRYFIGAAADSLDALLLRRESGANSVRIDHRQQHSDMEARLRAELEITKKDVNILTAQGALDPVLSTWHLPAAYSWIIVLTLLCIPIVFMIARKMCLG